MRIVFYGDSNTWGYNAKNQMRYDCRFTQQIQQAYPEYTILEEGLCGRTMCFEDPFDKDRNGVKDIQRLIKTHLPFDVLVLMLGTNDAKRMYNSNEYTIEKGMRTLMHQILDPSLYEKGFSAPKVWIVRPPRMNPAYVNNPKTLANFGKEGFDILEAAGDHLQSVAKQYHAEYIDPNCMARTLDGIHLDEQGHTKLANVLIEKIRGDL